MMFNKHGRFRSGAWVKFKADIPGAHSVNGKVVGIYHANFRGKDEGVWVVDKDGNDILVNNDGIMEPMYFHPEKLVGLEPIGSELEVPAKRLATASAVWRDRMRKKG